MLIGCDPAEPAVLQDVRFNMHRQTVQGYHVKPVLLSPPARRQGRRGAEEKRLVGLVAARRHGSMMDMAGEHQVYLQGMDLLQRRLAAEHRYVQRHLFHLVKRMMEHTDRPALFLRVEQAFEALALRP